LLPGLKLTYWTKTQLKISILTWSNFKMFKKVAIKFSASSGTLNIEILESRIM